MGAEQSQSKDKEDTRIMMDAQNMQALWMGQKEGYKNAIEDVLEIVDEISDSTCIMFGTMTYSDGKGELKNRVLALKGGDQE